ncbi:MAG: hypothetical protein RI885_1829 [Actinomycetota bacterium]
MRRLPALVVAAGFLATLTACAPDLGFPEDCETAPAGAAASTVEATGEVGEMPTVTFPSPLIAGSIESAELVRGDGVQIDDGDPVLVQATILNGGDGSVLEQTPYDGGGSLFTVGLDAVPELSAALECASVGSRIVAVAPPADDAADQTAGASVVYVVDVLDRFASRADGVDQLPQNGMPSVVTAPDGTPGITVPSESAPADFREAVLKLGDGEEVAADSTVVAKYTAVDWDERTVTTSTWTTGTAEALQLGGTEISVGLAEAIEGKKVGSQILAVIPPSLAGSASTPAESTATLVYVVDILGIVAP